MERKAAIRRGFTSVRVTIDPSLLPSTVNTERLVVHPDASLIPVPTANDANPLSAEEISYATQSLRKYGSQAVDRNSKAVAAQALNRALGGIRTPRDRATPARMEQLRRDVLHDLGPALDKHPGAREHFRRAFDRCGKGAAHYSMAGIRSCLEYRHDDLMAPLNSEYWEQVKPGS